MKCPVCEQDMRKIRWEITYNFHAVDSKEYDRVTYACKTDDVWISTEIPSLEDTKESSTTKKKKQATSYNWVKYTDPPALQT